MKENTNPVVIRRKDYSPPSYWIDSITLLFDIRDEATVVTNTMVLKHNPDAASHVLELDGLELELLSVSLDSDDLDDNAYELGEGYLKLVDLPDHCTVTVVTRIFPASNTALEGLYLSSGNYCTQCEAEGFRKITYYLDRPDVLAKFDVRVEAERQRYPVLLSNGNRVDEGDLDNGRHYVQWQDPYPKPSYLFALVAGNLEALRDSIQTLSGRHVDLVIYVEAHNLHKCAYAMDALKRSMLWDEEHYRLAYDLDVFMIVAVDDFNMGAMENKGLNIFNSRYVLADQQTATDSDFMGVEGVIAHEYFHNWTGNRVTCRDWFQLSLKEGLTVFRDQQFSGDMNSRAVKRIEDVRLLRLRQFPEDASPMAHPIRPDEYLEINNFYTVTVYEKGAEVIRMMHTLLGSENYHKGIDLYFERFDGTAATCDNFVQAMEDASGVDLEQFRHWYSQAGTPVLDVSTEYLEDSGEYHVSVTQHCPPTPGQAEKKPFHIPLTVALLSPDGKDIPLVLDATAQPVGTETTLDVVQPTTTFVFYNVPVKPVPSLLRSFSAPVILNASYSNEELAFLMANDSDDFNRWEAGQRLCKRVVESIADGSAPGGVDDPQHAEFFRAFKTMLEGPLQDPALVAEALALPGIEAVAENHEIMHVNRLHDAITAIKRSLAQANRQTLMDIIEQMSEGPVFSVHSVAIGKRSLRNACLSLLGVLDEEHWHDVVHRQFNESNNMTDRIAALRILCHSDSDLRKPALDKFYSEWSSDKLVTDKWFTLQALSERQDTVNDVRALTNHPAFDLKNPNRLRSLIGAFCMSNTLRFHGIDGSGYQLLADFVLELDGINPQIAARLVGPLGRWQKMDTERRTLMFEQLNRVAAKKQLSPDVYEIVNKSLQAGDPTPAAAS